MASLNTSTNGINIKRSYQSIVDAPKPSGASASSPTYGQWALFTVTAPLVSAFQNDGGKESVLKVESVAEGELSDLIEDFNDGRIQFAFVKVKDPNTSLPKSVLIAWCGAGVPERTKGYFGSHLGVVSKLLHGYHVQVTARSDSDLTPEGIVQKVSDASGSKYAGGPAISSGGPPPPVSSKPVFTPSQSGAGGRGFNPLGARAAPKDTNVDADGWGSDAPPVTRSQLEKVESAYKPTKANISDLTSQKQAPSRFSAPQPSHDESDVVRGGYQPVGKVDIAALRRQAKEKEDLRPAPVKGAYEPVGKVDIAAIRARAQAPSDAASSPSNLSPAITGASGRSEESDAPKSLADRSAAFKQSERLTSLPKPKVANKFGGSSTFTGTKASAPTPFGAKPAPAAPVGTASRTFADEGGKTPAQLWAEKKARQGGAPSAPSPGIGGPASPLAGQLSGQKSGGGGWHSGYSGKSWAPVQTTRTGQSAGSNSLSQQNTGVVSASNTGQEHTPEEPSSPAGGVSSIRDRFKGAAPMGAPTTRAAPEPEPEAHAMPPPMDFSSKPNAGRGIPIPGLPSRPSHQEIPAEQHQAIPSPPRHIRTPSPEFEEPEGSPIRIAMPVARGASPEPLSAPEERFSPPPMPTHSLQKAASASRDSPAEPKVESHDPARAAGIAVAAAAGIGAGVGVAAAVAAHSESHGGKRALVQYDYEKAEDNELELREGEYVTNIEFVDEDWWMGQNRAGETGLFPSNYVELVGDDGVEEEAQAPPQPARAVQEEEEEHAPAPPAGHGAGPTATALYDYEAAEDNELSFPDGATITGVEFPDEDWWLGHYGGKSGLFPANYVQLDE
ncbi:uncharacterized protein BDZ99DRAFT_510977 [Mytilinidion resinicola]|uniref:Actin binding protein-like protein n=1 Tax=Mytilinidion resinicola TaxID=574789 RepID=A0A6A6YBC6_9PEZI|nr:uncharacterized protein BDZ99DRAFT_510977 [Mytilinidion resinicola]KAF2806112.1 hypothetical protein BDZ99DRAFT_510977 [Mytilinidion resinicola]